MDGCADLKRRVETVDDAVDVMQRKDVEDQILIRPLPRLDHIVDLRADVSVREDDAFGWSRRTGSVDYEGALRLKIIPRQQMPVLLVDESRWRTLFQRFVRREIII